MKRALRRAVWEANFDNEWHARRYGLHQYLCMYPLHKACATAAYSTGTPSTAGRTRRSTLLHSVSRPPPAQRIDAVRESAHGTAARPRSARTAVTGYTGVCACTHCIKHAPLRCTPPQNTLQRAL